MAGDVKEILNGMAMAFFKDDRQWHVPYVGLITGTVVNINNGGSPTTIATGTTIGTTDNGPGWNISHGVNGATFSSSSLTGSAQPVTDVPIGGQKIVLTDMAVSVDTAMKLTFSEETTGTSLFEMYLPANGFVQFTTRSWLKLTTANKRIQVKSSVNGNVSITAFYFSQT